MANNFRSISLLSALCKVVESVIPVQLHGFLHNILSSKYELKILHDTSYFVLWIRNGKSQCKKNIFCHILRHCPDFDKIWHEVFIYKLIQLNISSQLLQFTQSYFGYRTFYFHIINALSTLQYIISGKFQVSGLEPVALLNLLFNRMPRTVLAYLSLYADNTTI